MEGPWIEIGILAVARLIIIGVFLVCVCGHLAPC